MKDRSAGKKSGRQTDHGKSDARHSNGERGEHGSDDARRFSGDGAGERGYRGNAPPDVPPGSVPGGSYGAGGGYRQGDLGERSGGESAGDSTEDTEGDSGARASLDDFERGEWRGRGSGARGEDRAEGERESSARREHADEQEWSDGFGVHGFRGSASSPARPAQRSGYGEQGFGAGESRGGRWGGGERGGYGGGQPGGVHGTRGGGWAAAGERFEQGRGPRSYGPDGWGGRSAEGAPSVDGAGAADAPWRQSEFAGRGEFGDGDVGTWNQDRGYSSRAAAERAAGPDNWKVPGPHTGRGPEGYRRAEAAIRDDVCERLTRHGQLDASRIQVQVENGEVILQGTVDSRPAKRMAEETAETVSGVRDVHNRLRIDRGND